MTFHWSWVILIPMIIIFAIMIYDTYMSPLAIIDYPLHPQAKILAAILILVYVGLLWIYSTSRILYNYFTKGKPISSN